MPNDAIQKTDNREETARWTRQVEHGKRRIKQKPGRCRREGAPPAKRTRKATKSTTATKATPKGRGTKGK